MAPYQMQVSVSHCWNQNLPMRSLSVKHAEACCTPHPNPSSAGEMSASELKKLQRKQKKAKLKAQAKAQEEMKGL